MARVVVDGQGVKALMERDKANFELRPTLDADPLEGLDASQHRSVLQGVVEGAAAAKCTVATIQLWNELLAEDKGMKINKESRNKVCSLTCAQNTLWYIRAPALHILCQVGAGRDKHLPRLLKVTVSNPSAPLGFEHNCT